MREIKFRGKRFDENHNNWIYGHLHMIDTCGEGYTGKAIQQQYGKDRPFSVRVKDETIGQYTGLKDKNGKEIFEGDIALYEPFETHNNDRVIVYEDGAFYGKLIRNGYGELLGELDNLNVIGNIHENPELLER